MRNFGGFHTGLLAAIGIAASMGAAQGQDHSWDGIYAGVSVGRAASTSKTTAEWPQGGYWWLPQDQAAGIAATYSPTINSTSAVAGFQAGYNKQIAPHIVVGLELDWNGQFLKASKSTNQTYNSYVSAQVNAITKSSTVTEDALATTKTGNLFLVRPKLGYTVGPALFYATGGYASAQRSQALSVNYTSVTIYNFNWGTSTSTYHNASANSQYRSGWTVGSGAEFAFDHHWTLKGEYLHVDLGTMTSALPFFYGSGPSQLRQAMREDIVRTGINYKF